MGEARHKPAINDPSISPAARELLTAIAQAKAAAVALHEADDDDLPGAIGDFVAIFPDGRMSVIGDDYMRRAAMAFFVSRRFEVGKPRPKAKRSDIPRAEQLLADMRLALSAGHTDVVPPPNFEILAITNNGAGMSPKRRLESAQGAAHPNNLRGLAPHMSRVER